MTTTYEKLFKTAREYYEIAEALGYGKVSLDNDEAWRLSNEYANKFENVAYKIEAEFGKTYEETLAEIRALAKKN